MFSIRSWRFGHAGGLRDGAALLYKKFNRCCGCKPLERGAAGTRQPQQLLGTRQPQRLLGIQLEAAMFYLIALNPSSPSNHRPHAAASDTTRVTYLPRRIQQPGRTGFALLQRLPTYGPKCSFAVAAGLCRASSASWGPKWTHTTYLPA